MRIRISHQINNHFCGPAVVVTVLRAFGMYSTQRAIARLARTNKKIGTSTKNLVSVLRSFGLKVEVRNGYSIQDLRDALKKGYAIIVCYTEPHQEEGHYGIVAGFKGKNILIYAPDERGYDPISMRIDEFESRWKDPLFTRSNRWAAIVH